MIINAFHGWSNSLVERINCQLSKSCSHMMSFFMNSRHYANEPQNVCLRVKASLHKNILCSPKHTTPCTALHGILACSFGRKQLIVTFESCVAFRYNLSALLFYPLLHVAEQQFSYVSFSQSFGATYWRIPMYVLFIYCCMESSSRHCLHLIPGWIGLENHVPISKSDIDVHVWFENIAPPAARHLPACLPACTWPITLSLSR